MLAFTEGTAAAASASSEMNGAESTGAVWLTRGRDDAGRRHHAIRLHRDAGFAAHHVERRDEIGVGHRAQGTHSEAKRLDAVTGRGFPERRRCEGREPD